VDRVSGSSRRRVLVPQALGADEFLRVTWHQHLSVLVFSQWRGATCVAAIPVRIADAAEVAELLTCAVVDHVVADRDGCGVAGWPAPHPHEVVSTDRPIRLSA